MGEPANLAINPYLVVDVHPGSPEQFGKFLMDERSKLEEAVKVSGAKVD